jgi:DNA-binding response OmpR family regulator
MQEDKMEGFLLGGDDYVTKPYSFEELKFRINVFLRRRKVIEDAPKEAINVGNYLFDYPNLDLSLNGRPGDSHNVKPIYSTTSLQDPTR